MPYQTRIAQAKRRQQTGSRLILAAMAAGAVSVVVLLVTIVVARQSASRIYDYSLQSRLVAQHAGALMQDAAAAEANAAAFGLTGRRETLVAYEASRTAANASEARLLAITRSRPELSALASDLTETKQAAFDWLSAGSASVQAGRPRASGAAVEGAARMNALRASVAAIISAANQIAATASDRVQALRGRLDAMIYGLIGLVCLTFGIAVYYFARESALLRFTVRELEAARAAAVAADAAKTRFLAMASHDMRQPLHALTLYLSALNRRVKTDDAKSIVLNMEMAASSLTRMFSGLLDLARIEAGVLKPNSADVPVADVFAVLAGELSEDCERARVKLRIAPTSAVVWADPELLESILRNLLTNAIKYAAGGRVLLGCRRAGDEVRIEVRDEGPGIPEEKLVLLFGEFVRLERANAAAKEGLGLGLSIASRMATLLGTQLQVASTPGKGTVFWIALPRRARKEAPRAETPQEAPSLQGMRAAITDDDPDSLAAMTRVLEDAGAKAAAFSTAEDFVAAVRGGARFDVLIADPVLYRQAQGAGGGGVGADVVVIVTGATDAGTLARLQASGETWLVKPVPETALIAAAAQARQVAAG